MKTFRSIWMALLLSIVTIAFLVLPLLSVFLSMPPQELWEKLHTPTSYQALQLSIFTSFVSLFFIIVFGTPLAYLLAHRQFMGKGVVEVIIQMPIVAPPAVAGVGLLLVFGRMGWLGQWLDIYGITIAFSTIAVIMAQIFIAAPFYIRSARTAFSGVDQTLVSVSRTLGASRTKTFYRIVLPLAFPGLLSGLALSWARALGEFGATIVFAGNLPGVTQTMPLAVFSALEQDLEVAIALSALLLAVAFAILMTVKGLEHWPEMRRKLKQKKGRKTNAKLSN